MKFRLPEIPPPKLINTLRSYNLLPAIVFMPTRRRCDEAATEVALDQTQKIDVEKQEKRSEIYQEFLQDFPEIRTHKHRKILINGGIAAHHAGHIPAWKLLVEKMMSKGLLNAIFATSTVAAGVDFPARTVVISNADTRGNDGWRSLQASELQQMTGRAGRRGKDNVGFVILAPSNFQNPPKIAELLKSPPNALESKFRATYTSLLNLLDAFGNFQNVRDIAEKSFAFRDTVRTVSKLEKQIEERRISLTKKLAANEFGYTINDVRGFERLNQARTHLQSKRSQNYGEVRRKWLEENVEAGRIVTKSRNSKRLFLVLSVFGEKVATMREDGQGVTLALSHIGRVYENKYPIKEASLDRAFEEISDGINKSLIEPKNASVETERDAAIEIIDKLKERFLPEKANEEAGRNAAIILWDCWDDAEFIEKTARDIDYLKAEIWLPFEHRAKVLDHFGYLDFRSQKVTERGKWLADLRVDRPLIVGEVLQQGIFENMPTKQVAGLMAALAADADRNYGELYLSDELLETLTKVEDTIFKVSDVEWKNGIEPAPEMNFSAAAAAERWADGMAWSDLVFNTKAEEGDLVRLLSRTGEALMQIAHQKDANPEAAAIARTTADIILREPIR